jgi:7-carboxy-7-deazaguanine synthase
VSLRVNEVFGPTIQGEGRTAGRHCLFIRLSQCNLHCWWCDTPYTWAFTEHKAAQHKSGIVHAVADEEMILTGEQVWDLLMESWDVQHKPTTVVISGGEPMLQQRELGGLVAMLKLAGNHIEVETAGTIIPTSAWTRRVGFNVSPKLAHSGNSLLARRNGAALRDYAMLGAQFKFVVSDVSNFKEIEELITLGNIKREQVWIMPEGTTIEATVDHARLIVDYVLEKGWNITLRNHVIIWGNERAK